MHEINMHRNYLEFSSRTPLNSVKQRAINKVYGEYRKIAVIVAAQRIIATKKIMSNKHYEEQ